MIRQETARELLDLALRLCEDGKYSLALPRVEEALGLEPDSSEALRLKNTIQAKLNDRKPEQWFRLARRHLDRGEYEQAQQALQKILEVRPHDSYTEKMLAEVERKRNECQKIAQEKQQLYQSGVQAWQEGKLAVALGSLERVLELERRSPDPSSPTGEGRIQGLLEEVRAAHETLNRAYAQALEHRKNRLHKKALSLCDSYLAKYRGEDRFQSLKLDIEEDQRLELSAYVAEANRQLAEESDLEKRVSLLEQALKRYPDEPHFAHLLAVHQKRRDLVRTTASQAEQLEAAGQFPEALGLWQSLRNIYPQYPGLDDKIEQLSHRKEVESQLEAKRKWMEQIEYYLSGLRDYARAAELARKAIEEFPGQPELEQLFASATENLNRVHEANRLFSLGQEWCRQGRLEEGTELLRQASRTNESDPVIRSVLLDTLTQRASKIIDRNWRLAEALIQEALQLDPQHEAANSLMPAVAGHKQKEFVESCVSRVRQLQTEGDLSGAIAVVEEGISQYPMNPALLQVHYALLKALRAPEAPQDLRTLTELRRSAEGVRDVQAMEGILERAQDIAAPHSADARFQEVVEDLGEQLVDIMKVDEREPAPAPPTAEWPMAAEVPLEHDVQTEAPQAVESATESPAEQPAPEQPVSEQAASEQAASEQAASEQSPLPSPITQLRNWFRANQIESVAVLSLAVMLAIAAVGFNEFIKIPIFPAQAVAKAAGSEVRVYSSPERSERVIVSLTQGSRVNVLELPTSQYGEWVKVQYVTSDKNYRPGYARSSELSGWSSQDPKFALELLKVFAPEQWASEADMREQLNKLDDFVSRFGSSPQGPEANLLMARIDIGLAHTGKNAGRPYKYWQAYLLDAAERLKLSAASPVLAGQARHLSQELEDLRSKAMPNSSTDGSPDISIRPARVSVAASEAGIKEAERLWKEGQYDQALRALDRVLQADPNYKPALLWRDRVMRAKRRENGQ